jgi:hypothetical protein
MRLDVTPSAFIHRGLDQSLDLLPGQRHRIQPFGNVSLRGLDQQAAGEMIDVAAMAKREHLSGLLQIESIFCPDARLHVDSVRQIAPRLRLRNSGLDPGQFCIQHIRPQPPA